MVGDDASWPASEGVGVFPVCIAVEVGTWRESVRVGREKGGVGVGVGTGETASAPGEGKGFPGVPSAFEEGHGCGGGVGLGGVGWRGRGSCG